MSASMEENNKRARGRALDAGRSSYTAEVVEYWPTCTTCDMTIRYRSAGRVCSCPGVTWRFSGVIGRSPERIEPAADADE